MFLCVAKTRLSDAADVGKNICVQVMEGIVQRWILNIVWTFWKKKYSRPEFSFYENLIKHSTRRSLKMGLLPSRDIFIENQMSPSKRHHNVVL